MLLPSFSSRSMRRSVPVASALLLLLSLYACSSEDSSAGPQDAGVLRADDASRAVDGPTTDAAPADAFVDLDSATDAATDAGALDAQVDAGPPAVRFIGRFDMTAAAGPKVSFPGAQIIARFMGTEVKATFSDAMLGTDYGANRWEVVVDGAPSAILQLDRAQPTTYTLATALPFGPHTVELYKLTEGNVGTTQFRGFDFSGGVLLPPPPAKTRRMQFLGDSASSGYGVDGPDASCIFSAETQNERKSYPALIAHDLLADSHNLAVAGKGVYQNNYRPDDTAVFSVIYQRVGVGGSAPAWSYTSFMPDVVWITLGGNDYDVPSLPAGAAAPPAGEFETKYDALVTTVRAQHPNAHIFCSVAPSLNDTYPAGYSAYTSVKTAAQNVVNAHKAAADQKIHFFEFARSTHADLTACQFHVNAAKHRAMANEAMLLIKAKTGW